MFTFQGITVPVMQKKAEKVSKESLEKFRKSLENMEAILEGNLWVAGGEHYSVADIAIAVTLSGPKEAGLTFSNYPNVKAWIKRCEKQLPGYADINLPGAKTLATRVPASIDFSTM
ncbi:hypothetical protein SK128_025059 [Halocaridina rubra]|uniref:GST C-terminal domain-containing protein n=1 Tax=Halocaridina rubra TaxID=373956 RepID=A0AAN8X7Z6_HALRR